MCSYIFPEQKPESTQAGRRFEAIISVRSNTFFLRLLASPDLGFAEAYMYGDVDVDTEHLIDAFCVRHSPAFHSCTDAVCLWYIIQIFILNSRNGALASLTSSTLTKVLSVPAQLTAGRFVASLDNSRANISAHYDLGNGIFKGASLACCSPHPTGLNPWLLSFPLERHDLFMWHISLP